MIKINIPVFIKSATVACCSRRLHLHASGLGLLGEVEKKNNNSSNRNILISICVKCKYWGEKKASVPLRLYEALWKSIWCECSTVAAVQERVKITAIRWAFGASYGFLLASPMNSWSSRAGRLIISYELRHPVAMKIMCICRSMNDEWTQYGRREHWGRWVYVCNGNHIIFGIKVSNMKFRGRSTSVLILAGGWMLRFKAKAIRPRFQSECRRDWRMNAI